MIILTIKTDQPKAEIGLYDNEKRLAYETWSAHRELSETIHLKIEALLKGQKIDWQDIEGLNCFAGPGSFTGLRIGLTVGNALSQGLKIPIVSTKTSRWIVLGTKKLLAGQNDEMALPDYGAPPHITKPRK